MGQEEKPGSKYVRKETMWVVAFIALGVGFVGGVILGVYKFDSYLSVQTSAPPEQAPQSQGPSPEQADKILELEGEVVLNPENVETWTQLGNLYFDTNQFDKAIGAYKRSLELNPGNANVLTDLGVMYRRAGQPSEAIAALDKAMAIDPSHEVSRFNKGVVLMHDLNDHEGAIQAWEELIKLNPSAMTPSGQSVREMVEKFKERKNK